MSSHASVAPCQPLGNADKKNPLENESQSRMNREAGAKAQKFFCKTAMSSVSVDSLYTPLLRECALRQRVFSV